MGFAALASAALTGSKLKKFERLNKEGSLSDFMNQSGKPVATDHTHSDDSSKEERRSEALSLRPDPSFMGKGQVENFSSLTDTSAVDRGGRAVNSSALDPVGIKPAMNPSLATPVDIDEQGINSLY